MTGASGENLVLLTVIIIVVCILLVFHIRLMRRHAQLKIALETSTAMEQHLRDEQFKWQTERHMHADQLKALTTELANAQQDLIMIKQQNDSQSVRLREKNHQLTEQTKQLESEIERLQDERTAIENNLMHANERWKEERQRLDQELIQTREKFSRAQQKITLLETRFGELKSWQERCRNLQTQYEKVQNDHQALEDKLATQHKWAIQVQQALEEEVAQLSARLKQNGQSVAK
jgi:chromosome segregation ATPase